MIILIDNYDSFTWNLYHFLGDLGCKIEVHRNDKISVSEVINLKPKQIVISPGPCDPNSAGISMNLVNAAIENDIPLLGVCLGHQSIAQAMGGEIIRCHEIIHGKTDSIFNDQKTIFNGLPDNFKATRYHSLVVSNDSLPNNIEISAKTNDGIIMGIRHKESRVEGIQFHPESIATDFGHKILENFIGL
jgi:anthranilate synthase component 2|tara:strand:+ start:964 stop:1530 length:567 start_codon:yes stop_codon:yes gene_type:complete